MPSENKTPHYGLNQWQANEYPKRVDFVADNDAIDAALKENANKIDAHKIDTSAHITTATHTRIGTVNNLEIVPGAKNLTFLATATIADGDTWTVNGQSVAAVLQNGELLPGELFKSGCWVTGVRLSDDGTQLFFRAGASTVPSIFGNGSDGDAVISGIVTLPVPVPHQSIVEMQYKSLTINAGAILKAAAHNAGLIIRVQGDCIIHGMIDQSELAPKINYQNSYPYPAQLICGNGGNSGNSATNYRKEVITGSSGMTKRPYGGGYGAGGPGGWGCDDQGESYVQSWKFTEGGRGGDAVGIEVDKLDYLFYGGISPSGGGRGNSGIYGGGGSGGAPQRTNDWTLSGRGGNKAGEHGQPGNYDNVSKRRTWGGNGGGAGDYGGGVILLYVGGNLIIDGQIRADGGKGGNSLSVYTDDLIYAGNYIRGGGGGGGGGGAIYIVYRGTKSITGIMSVAGGLGGTGANNGSAGGVGSITVIQQNR